MASPDVGSFYRTKFWLDLRAQALRRDGYRCTVPGCHARARRVDHIATRPPSPDPTPHDVLRNLRSLCTTHDNQVKEDQAGTRRSGGAFTVRGCDADGWPLDPKRRR